MFLFGHSATHKSRESKTPQQACVLYLKIKVISRVSQWVPNVQEWTRGTSDWTCHNYKDCDQFSDTWYLIFVFFTIEVMQLISDICIRLCQIAVNRQGQAQHLICLHYSGTRTNVVSFLLLQIMSLYLENMK